LAIGKVDDILQESVSGKKPQIRRSNTLKIENYAICHRYDNLGNVQSLAIERLPMSLDE
jgi:hypothetical protein